MSTEAIRTPKDSLKDEAAARGCNLKDLIVLAPSNDPLNCGSPTDIKQAKWFAAVWSRFGFQKGTHLRRIHYVLVSQLEPVLRYDGRPYHNTEDDWKHLQDCSRRARYLRLVAANDFVDHRNPAPTIFAPEPREPAEPDWEIEEFYGFEVPSIGRLYNARFDIPDILVGGYEYHRGEQPYHLEIWVEKTTINDILIPICERYGVNLVTSAGFQSITAAIDCLSRADMAIALDRPVRILYIADFDPAGAAMPRAVARQLEFWREVHDLEADIKLTPIALTRQQVAEYNLPRTPIKSKDARKGNFEDCFGEGAVELDALEAIHPGELAKIVTEAVEQYRDEDLEYELSSAEYEAEQIARDEWEQQTQPFRKRAEELKAKSQAVVNKHTPELERIRDAIETGLAPIGKKMQELEDDFRVFVDHAPAELDVDLPDRPTAEVDKPDEDHWLFDSQRSYDEQLNFYEKHKQGRL